jgi:hypothetical protein
VLAVGCRIRSFCHESKPSLEMKKSTKREERVNFRLAWRPAGISRHNQQRSVEEGRSLLGGTHAMKSVKPSVDILEGYSTGFNMDFSAPHLIHKWFTGHSRLCSCC